MIDYSAILTSKYPGTNWTLDGTDYAGLTWLDESTKPTQAELDALWPQVDYETQYEAVSNTRHKEYIKTSDPIFFEWQRGTKTQAEWEAAVQAIKDANPYPPAPSAKKK
jgi:hypothetical protein